MIGRIGLNKQLLSVRLASILPIISFAATAATPPPIPSLTPTTTPTLTSVPADYTGSGTDEIGIFRPGTGLWVVCGLTRVYYGVGGDSAVTR